MYCNHIFSDLTRVLFFAAVGVNGGNQISELVFHRIAELFNSADTVPPMPTLSMRWSASKHSLQESTNGTHSICTELRVSTHERAHFT